MNDEQPGTGTQDSICAAAGAGFGYCPPMLNGELCE
jgi:hypothetical protein